MHRIDIARYEIIAEHLVGSNRKYYKDHWSSDWNGDEVGFDDVLIVGLYHIPHTTIWYYVDTETGEVLDAWTEDDED